MSTLHLLNVPGHARPVIHAVATEALNAAYMRDEEVAFVVTAGGDLTVTASDRHHRELAGQLLRLHELTPAADSPTSAIPWETDPTTVTPFRLSVPGPAAPSITVPVHDVGVALASLAAHAGPWAIHPEHHHTLDQASVTIPDGTTVAFTCDPAGVPGDGWAGQLDVLLGPEVGGLPRRRATWTTLPDARCTPIKPHAHHVVWLGDHIPDGVARVWAWLHTNPSVHVDQVVVTRMVWHPTIPGRLIALEVVATTPEHTTIGIFVHTPFLSPVYTDCYRPWGLHTTTRLTPESAAVPR